MTHVSQLQDIIFQFQSSYTSLRLSCETPAAISGWARPESDVPSHTMDIPHIHSQRSASSATCPHSNNPPSQRYYVTLFCIFYLPVPALMGYPELTNNSLKLSNDHDALRGGATMFVFLLCWVHIINVALH